MPDPPTQNYRIAAIYTCTEGGKLLGMRIGLSDFKSMPETRNTVIPSEVSWLTPIGSITGDCDIYLVPRKNGIVEWQLSYDS